MWPAARRALLAAFVPWGRFEKRCVRRVVRGMPGAFDALTIHYSLFTFDALTIHYLHLMPSLFTIYI